jgi:hypothetical protein
MESFSSPCLIREEDVFGANDAFWTIPGSDYLAGDEESQMHTIPSYSSYYITNTEVLTLERH